MAIIDKTVKSGTVVGKVEDITDFITALDPDETFYTNRFGRTSVTSTKHEWLNDNLRPARDNATMEATDFDVQKARPRTRSANFVQQFMSGYSVTDTTQAIKKYGVRDELAYQFTKCGKETARDLEYAIVNNKVAKAEDTEPARFGGVAFFLEATKPVAGIDTKGVVTVNGHEFFNGDPVIFSAASGGALDSNYKANTPYYVHVVDANTFTVHATPQETMMSNTDSTAIKPSGQVAASKMVVSNQNVVDAATSSKKGEFDFDLLNDTMQLEWKRGGSPDTIVCSGKNKRKISGWTPNTTKTRDADKRNITEVVDVIETDFGRVDVNAHRMYTDDVVDLMEFQYWKLGYLIPFHTENPPRTGTYKQKVITGSVTLECTAPIASARIKNISK